MADKEVTAKVNADGHTVTLSGERGLPDRLAFRVANGDTLRWTVTNAKGLKTHIKCTQFPRSADRLPLLAGGEIVIAGSGTRRVKVIDNAHAGRYRFEFALEAVDGTRSGLRCLWPDGSDVGMAGGEKSGEP